MNLFAHLHRAGRLAGCLALLAGSAAILASPAFAEAEREIPPVATTTSLDPAGAVRGTMIMVHGGGWAGHSAEGRDLLMKTPGSVLLEHGWRVVSIDYEEGTAGLQDVLNATGAELARKSGDGPLCVYGESSGAHLALVAASRRRSIDCVIGLGTPTDLALYAAEGSVSPDFRVRLVATRISSFFGTTPDAMAAWDPVSLAPSIHADALLVSEAADPIVPPIHMARYQSARPTTETVEFEAGDPDDPSTRFVHGTISEAGRAHYASAIGAFADRAVANRRVQRSAARTGCAHVNRSLAQAGLPDLRRALGCLARNDVRAPRAGTGTWRQTSVTVRGEVSAARIWARLRASTSGRLALVAAAKRRANVIVRAGDRSRVVLRAVR